MIAPPLRPLCRPRAIAVPGGFDELPRIRGVDTVDQLSYNPTAWTNQKNAPIDGGMRMRGITAMVVFLLGAGLFVSGVSRGIAGEQRQAPIHQYTGQIQSIKIDRCGLQPGTCEGSVILKLPGGQEVTLAILPGTWIQRGDHLVLIDELGVGNYITARTTPLPEEARRPGTVGSNIGERAITLQDASRP
jgi:hypothetical protein